MARKQTNLSKPTSSLSNERQLLEYIDAALERVVLKELEDGTWFAEVPALPGVWANARDRESAVRELADVVRDWVVLGQSWGEEIPILDGIDLNNY